MNKQTITAVIPAKNEEKNIEYCLNSLQWCDKLQVLWMGNDATGEIARKSGAEVKELNKSDKDDFIAVQKNINWAIDHATTDWIIRIDADEVATPELKEEIVNILTSNIHHQSSATQLPVAYGIPRKQYFWGGFLKGGDWTYDRLVRLFRPKFARYEPFVAVHEQFRINGRVGYLNNALLHYSHPTLNDAVRKFHSYTDIQIKDIHDSKILALLKMVLLPPYIFLRWMIWHKGYRDGVRGIIAGLFRSWYEFILYRKYLKSIS